jgi:ketosteroid isomerase-like protein
MSKNMSDQRGDHFASPEFAEVAFYEAIGRGDLKTLMSVWSEEEEVVCIHPTGQKFSGLSEIRDGWQSVLTQSLKVAVTPIHRWQTMVMAVHIVQESLFVGDDPTPHGPLYSTNIYMRGAHGWRLVSHQSTAAIDAAHTVSDSRTLH